MQKTPTGTKILEFWTYTQILWIFRMIERSKVTVEQLPIELILQIFSMLDIQSLSNASVTCKGWNHIITLNDSLWKRHCIALKSVCPREIDNDIKKGDLSWKEILVKSYRTSQVKCEWLSGRYSNIQSPDDLSGIFMCELDADTWGEILDEELKRKQ